MRTVIRHPQTARPAISVNGAVIPDATIAREVQNHACGSPRQAWEAASRALVIRELLLQRARAIGIDAEPRTEDGLRETEEEALIRVLLAAEVRTPKADDDACRRYYESNPRRFRGPDLFEPMHILFRADRHDEAAYAVAVQRAEAALAELAAAPERFEAFAVALSDCPSAQDGGRLGQIAAGETTPEFEAALRALEPGETCRQTVRTRYGVHIVRLERKVAGAMLPFDRVRDRIAAYLEENVWRRAVSQYVALLAGNASIAGVDMPAAQSPLVQ
ncbi:MAG: peptidylprolyl isomerase [Proteobacteria bacterium]|nr:peptidylprolyl isomerase [Pseudomonadota bacterium]